MIIQDTTTSADDNLSTDEKVNWSKGNQQINETDLAKLAKEEIEESRKCLTSDTVILLKLSNKVVNQ